MNRQDLNFVSDDNIGSNFDKIVGEINSNPVNNIFESL